ncbi:MAG: hypothetical protein JWN30_571 [Bacilli bacterium]|nr:hypothetical protein [Bacilli bacterium]
MDWGRAKTYLLLAFLLLDVLLGWRYLAVRTEQAAYVQSYADQLKDVKAVLDSRGVQLMITDVPRTTPELRYLHVRFDQTAAEEVAKKSLENWKDKTIAPQVPVMDDSAVFTYVQAGTYQKRFLHPASEPLNYKGVDHLYELLSPHVWRASEYQLDTTLTGTGQQKTVRYLQMYNQYALFTAALLVNISTDRVESYTQNCLQVLGEEGNKQQVLPALNALHSFADSLSAQVQQPEGMKIQSIQLGYYSKRINNENDWYVAPMWRILTDRGSFYVNGFTGEVQGEERD